MPLDVRVTLFRLRPRKLLRFWNVKEKLFEFEPTYWPGRALADHPKMRPSDPKSMYEDFEGTFTIDEVLAFEREFWKERHFKGWESMFQSTCDRHEEFMQHLAAPTTIEQVKVEVFEWESGLGD